MTINRFPIPKYIELPGVLVRVSLTSPKNLPKDADADWRYTPTGLPMIRISSEIGIRRQRYLLYHELHHVIADVMHVALQDHGKDVAP